MKKLIVSFSFLALGLVAGLTMPRLLAQPASSAPVQKWEQFCEVAGIEAMKRFDKDVERWNERMKVHGANGYKLIALGGEGSAMALCYRRPAR